MAHVAAHDDIRVAGRGQREVLVVFRVAAFPNDFRRLDPLTSDNHDIQKTLAAGNGGEAIELRTEDHLPVLVLDFPRQDKAVGF